MRKFMLLLIGLVVMGTTACNLSTQAVSTLPAASTTLQPTFTIAPVFTVIGGATPTPLLPALPPLPGAGGDGLCAVYTTYSGADPNNKLSLRSEPRTDATQVLRLPNLARVYVVQGSQEVEAEGYHWLNIIYIDPAGIRYEGWTARDSFSQNGVRDPNIATLRTTGQQASC